MTSPSQPPTIAPDGRITCPNCAAEWYDCTHLKLASSSTPPSPLPTYWLVGRGQLERALRWFEQCVNNHRDFDEYESKEAMEDARDRVLDLIFPPAPDKYDAEHAVRKLPCL